MDAKAVRNYYEGLGCRLGYLLLLGGSQHFGLYPQNRRVGFSEKDAQKEHHDVLAKNLNLHPGLKVLDAGCGQGFVSCDLAKRYNVHITGVDITPYMLTRAARRAEVFGVQDLVQYELQDYATLKFPDASFDRIYTVETLCHPPDLRKVLGELYRVLKPGGKIVFMEYQNARKDRYSEYEKKMYDIVVAGTRSPSLDCFQDDDFMNLVREAGFQNVSCTDLSAQFLPSFRRLHRFARFPYMLVRALGMQQRFVNITIAVEFYEMVKKGLGGYAVYSATKS